MTFKKVNRDTNVNNSTVTNKLNVNSIVDRSNTTPTLLTQSPGKLEEGSTDLSGILLDIQPNQQALLTFEKPFQTTPIVLISAKFQNYFVTVIPSAILITNEVTQIGNVFNYLVIEK